MTVDLAVIILCHNEQIHLSRALEAIKPIAKEVFVVDSYSTDDSVAIARSFGASVLQNRFVNYAKQFQWALDNAQITAGWIMRLDADEVVAPTLADEIILKLPALSPDVVGVNLKRKHIFLGRWIRHGGRYPLILMRLWRRGYGLIEDRWMDEHMVVHGGETVTFDGGFADHNLKDLTFFIDKHNKYATREAVDILNQRYELFPRIDAVTTDNTSWQTYFKRSVKEKIYNRLPFQVSVPIYFIYRYLFQLGFLDGKEGLIYHFLQGFWYRFLVGAKLLELERAIHGVRDPSLIRAELARLTGLKIE
jgi:glycosyltransferase involved in cell wall biosynthesis